eukprot:TRINITY_DN55180_c0_g1_i2.p1 TRINITY_DN55180_c0_g1~~TRINITY_DN55180_c0_g1_i2.p1  ORF type:complete len:553 (-),score=82.50 TRINITY_DN55180_c0_g1_i2:210-1868(-)
MASGSQDAVWILTIKGNSKHLIEQLGVGKAEDELSADQRNLRSIAKKQNFDSSEPGRPEWACGAFVFVSVGHAAEIRDAIAESSLELKAHHVLVSGKYMSLMEKVLKTPVGESVRERYQSSRKGAMKDMQPVGPKTISHTESKDVMGPMNYSVAEFPLRLRRTFLEYAGSEDASCESRKTRTTGDRPRMDVKPNAAQYPGSERLPPRDGDYGSNRKNFRLRAVSANQGDARAPQRLGESSGDASDTAGSTSEAEPSVVEKPPSEAASSSLQSRTTVDFVEDDPGPTGILDRKLLEGIKESFKDRFADLDHELDQLEYLGDEELDQLNDISEYLLERSAICMCIFPEFLMAAELSPVHATASSAVEAPDARKASIKALFRILRAKAAVFVSVIHPCLRVEAIIEKVTYGVGGFAHELEQRMSKLLKQLLDIAGRSILEEAEKSDTGCEVDVLKDRTQETVKCMFKRSLSVKSIRDILQMLKKPTRPTPWKLASIEDLPEEEVDLTPEEKYELRKERAKQRSIRKLIREDNYQRNKPHKRGVPGARPARGKNVA